MGDDGWLYACGCDEEGIESICAVLMVDEPDVTAIAVVDGRHFLGGGTHEGIGLERDSAIAIVKGHVDLGDVESIAIARCPCKLCLCEEVINVGRAGLTDGK